MAYEVDVASALIDADTTIFALFTDGHEDKSETIARAVWSALRDLADRGPTQAELDHDKAGFAAFVEDPRASVDWLEGLGRRHLAGDRLLTREESVADFSTVTTADVQR